MSISSQETDSAKIHWQEIATNKIALAEALANLNPKDIRWLKKHPDLVQLIGGLAVLHKLPDPFHPARKPLTSVPK
jgi:hypothetical protein